MFYLTILLLEILCPFIISDNKIYKLCFLCHPVLAPNPPTVYHSRLINQLLFIFPIHDWNLCGNW
jgi:hypothetical protein